MRVAGPVRKTILLPRTVPTEPALEASCSTCTRLALRRPRAMQLRWALGFQVYRQTEALQGARASQPRRSTVTR